MGGYLARPQEGGPYPLVLVFQEIFGVNDHIQDVTRRVAAEGYLALAPEIFWRTAPGLNVGYTAEGVAEGRKHASQIKTAALEGDLAAALAFGQAQSLPGKVGCIGFCLGGTIAYRAACTLPITATASFYGGGIAIPNPVTGEAPVVTHSAGIRGEILCFFGGLDKMISPEQVTTIHTALADAKVRHEVFVYPDADHGFFCDQRQSYQKVRAMEAWEKVKDLFARNLKSTHGKETP